MKETAYFASLARAPATGAGLECGPEGGHLSGGTIPPRRYQTRPMSEHPHGNVHRSGRYPRARTSPWFFLVLAVMTLIIILAGVFHLDVVTHVIHWLAVVL